MYYEIQKVGTVERFVKKTDENERNNGKRPLMVSGAQELL